MQTATQTATPKVETPLTDPAHPFHRPVVAKATTPVKEEAKPAAKAKPVKEAKAAKPAKVKKAKPAVEGQPAKNPRSIVPVKFKALYANHNDTCGSKLALALKAATTTTNKDGRECLDTDALFAIAKANGVDVAKYKTLNNGQKRMNVGNKLAGLLKQGTKVVIGKQTFANADKALAVQDAA